MAEVSLSFSFYFWVITLKWTATENLPALAFSEITIFPFLSTRHHSSHPLVAILEITSLDKVSGLVCLECKPIKAHVDRNYVLLSQVKSGNFEFSLQQQKFKNR